MTTNGDLALRATVRELVAAFVEAEREVRESFARIAAAEDRVNAVFGNSAERYTGIRVSACSTNWRDNFRDPDEAIRLMRTAAWSSIVDRLELRRFMSIKRWDQLQRQLSAERHDRHVRADLPELPPITEESVMAFARDNLASAREMLQEAVEEVFEWLRPRGSTAESRLKTNSQLEVPAKVILPGVVEERWTGKGFEVEYRCRQNLVALERVFHALAGDGRMNVAGESELAAAIAASSDGTGETSLLRFKACKNGHLHLRFLSADLLARFNALAGGRRLRPAETDEERLRREVAQARAENERLKREAARRAGGE